MFLHYFLPNHSFSYENDIRKIILKLCKQKVIPNEIILLRLFQFNIIGIPHYLRVKIIVIIPVNNS
jgi:hypothetical protein